MSLCEIPAMASSKKSRITGRPKSLDPMLPIASFKGKARFKKWFEDLAREQRLDNSALIEHALVAYARTIGFKPPPER